MKKSNLIAAALFTGAFMTAPAFAALDSDSAKINMKVGLYAALTGLDDFTLSTTDADGSAGAVYSGTDEFNLESNGQVRVNVEGRNLANGKDSVETAFDLDGIGETMDTASASVHNATHKVSAQAKLGEISAQQAGAYSSTITLTVSAI